MRTGPCIVIDKGARRLRLVLADGSERSHAVALGHNAGADKQVEGDGATPLGEFFVCARNPRSRFFLSLCLSYPNVAHAARGLAAGLITADEHAAILAALDQGRMPPQKTRLGGEIYIHGEDPRRSEYPRRAAGAGASASGPDTGGPGTGGSGARDWTHGCIAVDNRAMQELFDSVPLGTPVSIRP